MLMESSLTIQLFTLVREKNSSLDAETELEFLLDLS